MRWDHLLLAGPAARIFAAYTIGEMTEQQATLAFVLLIVAALDISMLVAVGLAGVFLAFRQTGLTDVAPVPYDPAIGLTALIGGGAVALVGFRAPWLITPTCVATSAWLAYDAARIFELVT